MVRKLSWIVSALVAILSALLWSAFADAQEGSFLPPPIRPSVDQNGVELVSGQLQIERTDIVIGQPGAGGLSFGQIGPYINAAWSSGVQWYSGAVTVVGLTGPTAVYTVSISGQAESFSRATSPPNSPFVSVQGRGSTLSEDGANYTYTSPDGAVAIFSKSLTNVGAQAAAGYIVQMTSPDGEIRTYSYVSATCSGCLNASMNRLQAVTNNRGYQIKLTYQDGRINTTIPIAENGGWYTIASATGINMAVDYCDPTANTCSGLTQSWPTVNYSFTFNPSVLQVTDQLGHTTRYAQAQDGSSFAVRLPNSQTDDVVYTLGANLAVTGVNRHGRTWGYSYTTGTDLTTVVTDPQSRQSTYVFDATTGSIKSYTSTAGELTAYQNDAKGRPTSITLPTSELINYVYDDQGNITDAQHVAPGFQTLNWQFGWYSPCAPAICMRMSSSIDPAGNYTGYFYNAQGQPTGVMSPAQPNGVHSWTNYTYAPYQAYYKNAAGAIVAAGTSVSYLTSVTQCRTTEGCGDGSPDQLRTDIGYGADNVGNNRLPVTTTARDGASTLSGTTTLQYDGIGNLVSVDGPLAGPADKTVTRYDALRRVIGTISPVRDSGGPQLSVGVRYNYDPQTDLLTSVDTGNLAGQDDSAWASFPVTAQPHYSVVREFDAERRVTKTSLVAGGTTDALQQVSYDTLGRVDCRATRMNRASFAGLQVSACDPVGDGPDGPDRIMKYGYDNADRLTSVTSGFGRSDAIVLQTMTYLPGGRLSTLTDGNGNKTTYEYDPLGRLSRTRYPDPTNIGASSTIDYEEYEYNANSQVTSTRRRSGDVIGTPRDALGRITTEDVPGTAEDVDFSYDNQGRLLSALFHSTGTGVTQHYDALGRMDARTVFGRTLSYGYDLRGRRTQLTHPDGFNVTYGYSNLDELVSLTDNTGTTVAGFTYDGLGARASVIRPNGASTSYTPDSLERLQTLVQNVSGGFTESLTYNAAGQISTKVSSNDAYTPVPSPLNSTTTAQPDGQNKLTTFAGASVTHDANGDVNAGFGIGLGSLTYTYDALGKLRQASGSGSTALVDYDPAGMLRRVTAGGTTTEYLYDGDDLIAEYNGSAVLRRFVHGAGSDEPLVAYDGSGNKSWLHADERGSIITATDASGVASSSVKYTADGDSGTLVSPFGYTGQLYLPEIQLYYYKARMYSPKAGRFLQPDWIGYAGGMNLYGYVGNDPTNFVDPSGFCELWNSSFWNGETLTLVQHGLADCLREWSAAAASMFGLSPSSTDAAASPGGATPETPAPNSHCGNLSFGVGGALHGPVIDGFGVGVSGGTNVGFSYGGSLLDSRFFLQVQAAGMISGGIYAGVGFSAQGGLDAVNHGITSVTTFHDELSVGLEYGGSFGFDVGLADGRFAGVGGYSGAMPLGRLGVGFGVGGGGGLATTSTIGSPSPREILSKLGLNDGTPATCR